MTYSQARYMLTRLSIMGGLLWILMLISQINRQNVLQQIELLMLFGVSVIAPLGFRLTTVLPLTEKMPWVHILSIAFFLLSIPAVTAALYQPTGILAGILSLAWLAQTGGFALCGLWRFLNRRTLAINHLCVDAALIYAPISGVWLVAYCFGFPLLTFDPVLVLLTGVHFVYVTMGALIIAGMVGNLLEGSGVWPMYRAIAWVNVVSPALVAAGITTTQFTGRIALEALAVLIFASSFVLLSLLMGSRHLPDAPGVRMLILLSGGALLVTMALALAYSSGRFTGWWTLTIPQMVRWHGWLNAVGFTLCGLLAWNLLPQARATKFDMIPFSRLPWRWTIHSDFFERIDAVDTGTDSHPTGIVENWDMYRQPNFNPNEVTPEIQAFYEFTADHVLLVYPEWQPGFKGLARIYKRISKAIGQMNFPLEAESDETHITSQIVPLRDDRDGRTGVRGWIRTYTDTEETVYVAAYAIHTHSERKYMNIAFPLPGGNLTSILRLENMAETQGGVSLTSYGNAREDQGVYLVTAVGPVRLPINEIIDVYPQAKLYERFPSGFERGLIVAQHRMWLFGKHCLTLHYSISPAAK
ncbi:MAG: YndJ family protein [Chloroflexota bacterium]